MIIACGSCWVTWMNAAIIVVPTFIPVVSCYISKTVGRCKGKK